MNENLSGSLIIATIQNNKDQIPLEYLASEFERRSYVLSQALSEKVEEIMDLQNQNEYFLNQIKDLNEKNKLLKSKNKKLKNQNVPIGPVDKIQSNKIKKLTEQLAKAKQYELSYKESTDNYEKLIVKMTHDANKILNMEIERKKQYVKENSELCQTIKMLGEKIKELEFLLEEKNDNSNNDSDWSSSNSGDEK